MLFGNTMPREPKKYSLNISIDISSQREEYEENGQSNQIKITLKSICLYVYVCIRSKLQNKEKD